MKSKLKTYNFAESPICARYKFNGNPQSSKDVLEFIEKQINDIFHANTDQTTSKRKLTVINVNVIGQFFIPFFFCFFCLFEKQIQKNKQTKIRYNERKTVD